MQVSGRSVEVSGHYRQVSGRCVEVNGRSCIFQIYPLFHRFIN